jgi:GNAT superfamily N-acetyltransferase
MASLARSHPFYRHSEAAFFVAERAGAAVGRIGVFEHVPANDRHGTRTGYFGWFDSVDDQQVADILMGTAAGWARDRDLDRLVGPTGLLPSDGRGILVDGFDEPAVVGVAWHPRFYDRLLTGAGLVTDSHYLSGTLEVGHEVPEQVFTAADAAMEASGYRVMNFTSKRELRPWIIRIGHLYNTAMSENRGYTPVDDVEIERMADQLLPIADPRLVVLLLAGDEIAGYILLIPDVSEAIRASRGGLLPFGWLRILRAVRTTRRVAITGMGLTPEHRGTGANLILYARLARRAEQYRFTSAEAVQVDEDNVPMMKNLDRLGVPVTKRHRMYRLDL